MTFGTDIHVPLKINCNNFGDLLTFHLAPSSSQNLLETVLVFKLPLQDCVRRRWTNKTPKVLSGD